MKKSVVGGLILVLVFSLPVAAEFYRYTDDHGNTIYTDDITKVPPEQRQAVQSYDESVSRPEAAPSEGQAEKADPGMTNSDKNEKERLRLERQQDTLAKEFDALTAERASLDQEKKETIGNAQIKAYNRKTIEFNARIKAYEEKRAAHAAEVEKFNARMSNQEPQAESQ